MADRPNLVFIFSDQQRYDTLACYGNDWIQTPAINALADHSFVFQNAYVTQPVCTPARASLLTGLYPHSAGPTVNKMALPADRQSIAEMLPDYYRCAYFGKWHLGDDTVAQHGFEDWISVEDGHRRELSRPEYRSILSDYHRHLVENGFEPDSELMALPIFTADARAQLPEEFQMASFLGDRAAEFIEEAGDEPFVLYVSTFEPHSPYYGPLNDLYDPSTLPVGPAFLKRPEGGSRYNRVRADFFTHALESEDGNVDPYIQTQIATFNDVTTEDGWRTLRARYMANITLVDRMVGKITRALDRARLSGNTAVVFTSEHGEMGGDHGMLEKRSPYEEASRVPLLIRAPWLSDGQRMIGGSVSQIDLVPTLLDLLGQPAPGHLQGKSLVPAMRGERTLEDNDVIIEWNGISEIEDRHLGSLEINLRNTQPWRTIVRGRWKLNLCATDQCELYDLENDPHELCNLFDDPAQQERVRDLSGRVRDWQARTGDTAPLPRA